MPNTYTRKTLLIAALKQCCGNELEWCLSLALRFLITLAAICAIILRREGDDAYEWLVVAYLGSGESNTWYSGHEYWADALLAPHDWWRVRYFVAREH